MAQTVNDLASGATTVDTPGTPEALGPSSRIQRVLVRAMGANTGNILIGAADGPTFPLAPGEAIELSVRNPASVWIDAAVAGEGVDWIAETF